jgi:hypothetical protein
MEALQPMRAREYRQETVAPCKGEVMLQRRRGRRVEGEGRKEEGGGRTRGENI